MRNEESDSKCSYKKLKILALHGYRQNAEVFKAKTGSFRKIFHKFVEFTYITAPHKVILVHDIDTDEPVDANLGQSQDEGRFLCYLRKFLQP